MIDYDNSAMLRLIEERVHNDLYRRVLKLRLIDGWTYERIAEEVDRTPRQVYYIVASMTKHLNCLL